MFLGTREIAHMKSFMRALESLGKDALEIGQLPPEAKFVNNYFNDSSGTGPEGETDARGPWNTDGLEYEESPALASVLRTTAVAASNSGK